MPNKERAANIAALNDAFRMATPSCLQPCLCDVKARLKTSRQGSPDVKYFSLHHTYSPNITVHIPPNTDRF